MACTIDSRCLDEGFGGKTYKRKRAEQESQAAAAANPINFTSMEIDDSQPSAKPVAFGRPTYDGVIAGKVSGRNWKQPRKRASSRAIKLPSSATFEQRAREREVKKAYKERKEEIRNHKIEKRKAKEEREKKKKENILKGQQRLRGRARARIRDGEAFGDRAKFGEINGEGEGRQSDPFVKWEREIKG